MQVCVVWVLVCLDIPFTFHFNQISEFLQNTWITSCHINATFLVHILILCSFATSENSFKNFYHLSKISEQDEERMADERERAHTYGFWHKNRTPKKIECPTQSHVIHGKMNFWLVNMLACRLFCMQNCTYGVWMPFQKSVKKPNKQILMRISYANGEKRKTMLSLFESSYKFQYFFFA